MTIKQATYTHRGEKIKLKLERESDGTLKFEVSTDSPKKIKKATYIRHSHYKDEPEKIGEHIKNRVRRLEEKLEDTKTVEEATMQAFEEIVEEKNAEESWRDRF